MGLQDRDYVKEHARNWNRSAKPKKPTRDQWNALREHEERQNNIKRWKQTDWRKNALKPASRRRGRNTQPVSDEYVNKSLRWMLVVSLGFNAVLLYSLLQQM